MFLVADFLWSFVLFRSPPSAETRGLWLTQASLWEQPVRPVERQLSPPPVWHHHAPTYCISGPQLFMLVGLPSCVYMCMHNLQQSSQWLQTFKNGLRNLDQILSFFFILMPVYEIQSDFKSYTYDNNIQSEDATIVSLPVPWETTQQS